MAEIGVSVSEIIEVRGSGFNVDELLALILIGCEQLSKTPTGVFTADHIIIYSDGSLRIKTAAPSEVDEQFVPPEILEGNTTVDAAAVHVFCLGQVVKFAGGDEVENADVFSLVNIMTVEHIATRPSPTRLAQMAKNRLNIQNPKALLAEMFVLVMGDEDEDIDDLDVSSGMYVLEEMGEFKELREFDETESKNEVDEYKAEKLVDLDLSVSGKQVDLAKSEKKEDLGELKDGRLVGLINCDPFENDTSASTALSDYDDPFIDCRDGQNSVPSTTLQRIDFSISGNEFPPKQNSSECRKEKQGSIHLDQSEMILESFDGSKRSFEGPRIDKAFQWPQSSKIIDFNYDDDIVEHKEDEVENSVDFSLNETVRSPKAFSQIVLPQIIEAVDSCSSLSPISEVNEAVDKENGYNIHEEFLDANSENKAVAYNSDFAKPNQRYNRLNELSPPFIKDINDQIQNDKAERKDPIIEDVQQFRRQNSLLPHRISGRKSSERHLKRKTKAEPEFVSNVDSRNVCLKAPALRKKKITLHRVEQTDVVIELLNGKRIEVSCRSDAIAFEVADVVMRHMNYTENSFFGLTVLKDGEHFFLDDHQRLEKFAPPGWRNARQLAPKSIYILYLRFRYYPASLDFIKTNIVLHELYLQLRRDFLDDNIQPPREKVFEMAALALQAEFSDRSNTSIIDYFNIEYYLPKRYIDNNNLKRMVTVLAEFHSQYKGLTNQQAEIQFILACQNLSDYGAHLHRVFKSKPSYNLGNTPFGDPQTGIANWIGILTRGIIECEEQRSGRRIINEHLWQNTQTLQFDKKRFVIVSEKVTPLRSVFFTDHYTKSAYFVRFAASQHRFMIKMRQWKQTLRPGDSKYMQQALLNVEKTENVQLESLTKDLVDNTKITSKQEEKKENTDIFNQRDRFIPLLVESECPSTNAKETESRQFDAEGNSIVEAVENGDGYKFEVILEKDSRMGLGLTLVDGNLNGIKGVYVKSVIEGGAGMNGGILVGDRLLSINDISLKEKDRHAAVDLVKESGNRVRLGIFRWDAISAMLVNNKWKIGSEIKQNNNSLKLTDIGPINRSRTPPVQKKRADIPKKRIRAVSDFGAVGDNLPELNSEEILANMKTNPCGNREFQWNKQQNNIRNTSKASCNLDGLENDLDWDEIIANSSYTSDFNDNYDMRCLPKPKDFFDARKTNKSNIESRDPVLLDNVDGQSNDFSRITFVHLNRNESGNLGVQIASSGGSVYIKQLTANPALSHPNIRIGDKLIMVNGQKTQNLTHQQVVDLLRNSGNAVVLGLAHPETQNNDLLDDKEEIIRVVLDKSPTGSLGLSLAKKTGLEGIFIRTIGVGSAADVDGTLRVGDKFWEINGQSVNNLTPGAVVKMLKSSSNPIEIVVKRSVS